MAGKKEELVDNEELDTSTTEENFDSKVINKEEYIAKLNDDLLEQKKKTEEYFENLKRNMAEFDNFKKRMLKEKDSLNVIIKSDIITELLPILDNFETAMLAETKDKNFKNGMEMILNQLKDILTNTGLQEIDTNNTSFDPNLHEAVMHVDDDNYGEKEIIDVLRKGYKMGDKVIRHSMVKVAN